MAKRISRTRTVIEVDEVAGTYTLFECFYELDDDTVPGAVYSNPVGPNPCPTRVISSGELSGTLQSFLDSLKTDAETQEGI